MAKLKLAFKERRSGERMTLTGLMPGRLFLISSDRTLSARPLDVSVHGLGILMGEKVPDGTEIGLAVEKRHVVKMRVAWSKEDFGKRDLYRYGLECLDTNLNLEDIFLATGCLK